MKFIKQFLVAMTTVGALLFPIASISQSSQPTSSAKTDVGYTDGEVKRVDLFAGKITIKHGFIKSLDMPPMTMVFTVKEKSMLNDIATGDQVRFIVVSENGKMIITELVK